MLYITARYPRARPNPVSLVRLVRLLPSANMSGPEISKQYVPLICHGHSRPVTHLSFSGFVGDEEYYLISACKGIILLIGGIAGQLANLHIDNNPMLRDGVTGDWYDFRYR